MVVQQTIVAGPPPPLKRKMCNPSAFDAWNPNKHVSKNKWVWFSATYSIANFATEFCWAEQPSHMRGWTYDSTRITAFYNTTVVNQVCSCHAYNTYLKKKCNTYIGIIWFYNSPFCTHNHSIPTSWKSHQKNSPTQNIMTFWHKTHTHTYIYILKYKYLHLYIPRYLKICYRIFSHHNQATVTSTASMAFWISAWTGIQMVKWWGWGGEIIHHHHRSWIIVNDHESWSSSAAVVVVIIIVLSLSLSLRRPLHIIIVFVGTIAATKWGKTKLFQNSLLDCEECKERRWKDYIQLLWLNPFLQVSKQ